MEFSFTRLKLKKVYPLAISRGSSDGSQNLFVKVRDGDFTGVGEAAPATADVETLAKEAVPSLEALIASRAPEMGPWACWQRGRQMSVHPAALAAIDIALWDLLARKAGLPLHRMLGLERGVIQTSVTVGINPPDRVAELVPEMLHRWKARVLKVKLGSPAGIDHDQESYVAAWKPARSLGVPIRVDANGGWSPADAEKMMRFLAERDCDFVEQPLARGQEDALPELFARRPLPIWLDETVQCSGDIPPIADRCDGVNIKLMKTGGITEAVRAVATARACGLGTMVGCMSDSSIGIAAAASLSILFDHIDLDSHFNLDPDPAEGLKMVAGVVVPPETPGHGARLIGP